ncbi:2-keto-4-pentenoate hydratase [Aeromicrobium panaciterrae]|uniref:2-keto-4-pentenoate hydratase n=1 Tax=Aeromicrobium panaciterrae TaxID=363861 RepID=UPI0031E458A1
MSRTLTSDPVELAAHRLLVAAQTGQPCAPVRDLIDATMAYRVQQALTDERLRAGSTVIGRKIGLTSSAVQQQLGVDQPDFGVLFDDMNVSALDLIPFGLLLQPQAEAEIAFTLGADLDSGVLDEDQVRDAVAYASPAIEIVDSRVDSWNISYADTVADNASSGLFVLGEERVPLDGFDPAAAEMTMSIDGEIVSAGHGAASLGSPLTALAWLARTAREVGDPLQAGQIILSGALGPMVPLRPSAIVVASITGLGQVSAHFTGGRA